MGKTVGHPVRPVAKGIMNNWHSSFSCFCVIIVVVIITTTTTTTTIIAIAIFRTNETGGTDVIVEFDCKTRVDEESCGESSRSCVWCSFTNNTHSTGGEVDLDYVCEERYKYGNELR